MIRSMTKLLALSAALLLALSVSAAQGAGCGCQVECPRCHHICKLSVDKEKVTKYCWETECEPVCVPRVHFPWECGCPPKCAKVIHVNVLKKKEYECEECAYTWTPEPAECCADACHGGDGGSGCDVSCAAPSTGPAAPSPEEAQPASDAEVAPEPAAPLTGQRPTWFDSARQAAVKSATLPVRFLRTTQGQAQR